MGWKEEKEQSPKIRSRPSSCSRETILLMAYKFHPQDINRSTFRGKIGRA